MTQNQNRSEKNNLKLEMLKNSHSFHFFQIVRLFKLLYNDNDKPLKMRPNLSLNYPCSDVVNFKETDDHYLIELNMLGLYGVSSPLPSFYTEELIDEKTNGKSITRDFIDIITHRLYYIFYECFLKYKLSLNYIESDDQKWYEKLNQMSGSGHTVFNSNNNTNRLIRYIGILTQFPRSASGLKIILKDALDVPVEIIQFIKQQGVIPEEQRLILGNLENKLGKNTYLGKKVIFSMGNFLIQVGPIKEDDYNSYLPGTEKFNDIISLTNAYILDPLEFDIEIILDEISKTSSMGVSKLGIDSWIFSGKKIDKTKKIYSPINRNGNTTYE